MDAEAIELLLNAMEEHRLNRWRSNELDQRYSRLPGKSAEKDHAMNQFRCIPLDTDFAEKMRKSPIDDFGYPITKRVDSVKTYPCRHCLKEAPSNNGMLLLSYQVPRPKSVYGHPTAIFMCATPCDQFAARNTIPDIVRNRLVVFRSYAQDGMMIYDANELVDGKECEATLQRLLDRKDVAYINAHTAKAGCMLCRVERG